MNINFGNIVGKIKPMHAVGGAPYYGNTYDFCHYLQEAHIPYSRLHDQGLDAMRPKVDIPRIFPNFEADVNDPAAYDFEYTDHMLAELLKYDCIPYYRLGVTIENAVRQGFKPRNIYPPADFQKWAEICEHIIRHYNEGWADGFHYDLKYWEIWNEPENGHPGAPVKRMNQCWLGTKEEFYEFYGTVAKHLRKCFGDTVKIGGYAACTMYGFFPDEVPPSRADGSAAYRMEFFEGFLDYAQKNNVPLDFFTWHSYWDTPHNFIMAKKFREHLDAYGFTHTESHFNEWNTHYTVEERGTAEAAAHTAAVMLGMQDLPVDMLMYYDARFGTSVYGGLFNCESRQPYPTYYALKAFGELYVLGQQAECIIEEEGIFAVAATDGEKQAVMISNIGEDVTLTTGLSGFDVYLADGEHPLEKLDLNSRQFKLRANQIALLKRD